MIVLYMHVMSKIDIVFTHCIEPMILTCNVLIIELCTGAGAPVHFAGAGAGVGILQQKLRQTKL